MPAASGVLGDIPIANFTAPRRPRWTSPRRAESRSCSSASARTHRAAEGRDAQRAHVRRLRIDYRMQGVRGVAALPRCAPGWEEVGLRDRLVRAPRRAHGTRACGEGSSSWGWRPTSRGGLASDVSDDHRKNEAGEVVDLGRIVDPFEGLRRRSRLPPESGKLTAKTILPSL